MTTMTRTRPARAHRTPRYTSNSSSTKVARPPVTADDAAEGSWFIFILSIVLVLGIGLIGAVTYILLLG